MKTWDDWSDFNINKAVAKKLGIGLGIRQPKNNPSSVRVKNGMIFDYCNSWADMGPIIQSNNIMVGSYNGLGFACGNFRDGVDEQIWDYEFYHEKTPRAAAIVFLMMNGVNP